MFDLSITNIIIFLAVLVILIIISIVVFNILNRADVESNTSDPKLESRYQSQVKLLSDKYNSTTSARRPITELLSKKDSIPDAEQNFINFYAMGCRYTGYIGPIDEGYFDPDVAVQLAVNAGCRVFVLEIDYLDECKGETIKYFPRIVVRDAQNKLRIKYNSNRPICNSTTHSNIKDVCDKINFYAFAESCQNRTDPVVIVLYFLRQPPGSYKSKTVLDYYSNVAKALAPFQNRLLTNELDGGTFYRQKQDGRLLINKITDYNNKVLIFSNANTIGFREVQTYSPMEDLDFLINLRLSYTQTKLGITNNDVSATFGVLETVEDYMTIPTDRVDEVVENTKLRWTICLTKDPTIPVTKDAYTRVTGSFGVNCIPSMLFDNSNEFMFTDKTFKTYSYIPKPESLRYIKPPIVIPAEPNPNTNANQGILRAPTI